MFTYPTENECLALPRVSCHNAEHMFSQSSIAPI